MKLANALPMLRLALSAIDRDVPNVEMARGILREVLGSQPEEIPQPTNADVRAVSIGEAARALSFSPKHVRTLIKSGRLDGAVIGSGRGTRVIVSKAIALLGERRKGTTTKSADEIEAAGASYARRGRLRAV